MDCDYDDNRAVDDIEMQDESTIPPDPAPTDIFGSLDETVAEVSSAADATAGELSRADSGPFVRPTRSSTSLGNFKYINHCLFCAENASDQFILEQSKRRVERRIIVRYFTPNSKEIVNYIKKNF